MGMDLRIQTPKFRFGFSRSDYPIASTRCTCKNQSQLLLYATDYIHKIIALQHQDGENIDKIVKQNVIDVGKRVLSGEGKQHYECLCTISTIV